MSGVGSLMRQFKEEGCTCKHDGSEEAHSCPAGVELAGEDPEEPACTCCEYCTQRCADDI